MSNILPFWLTIHHRRVLLPFLSALARSPKWQALYIISPWISDFEEPDSISFRQLLKRLRDDDATAYVVTRSPQESWHGDAIERMRQTQRANIVFSETLHAKLYICRSVAGTFASFGSANLTQNSMTNRELGVLVNGRGAGEEVLQLLLYEAADIYRTPDRKQYARRTFR